MKRKGWSFGFSAAALVMVAVSARAGSGGGGMSPGYGGRGAGTGESSAGTGSSSTDTSGTASGAMAGTDNSSGTSEHFSALQGRVQNFDRTNNTLTISGTAKMLKVDSSTQVMKNGSRASLDDIKEGERVRASYSGSGDTVNVKTLDIMPAGTTGSGTSGSSKGTGSSSDTSGTGSSSSSGPSSTGSSSGSPGSSSSSDSKSY
jgi:hypothetical protein